MKKVISILVIGFFIFSFAGSSLAAAKPKPKPKKVVPATPATPAVKAEAANPAPAEAPAPGKAGFFYEGGLAGGGAALEFGYGKSLNNKVYLSGALGGAAGSGFSVIILDPIRISYDMGSYMVGAGLNYAMYSNLVTGVPGLSGTIPNKNMFGAEVFAAKQFGKLVGTVGFSTALGLRAVVGYLF